MKNFITISVINNYIQISKIKIAQTWQFLVVVIVVVVIIIINHLFIYLLGDPPFVFKKQTSLLM